MDEVTDQAEVEVPETEVPETVESQESVSDILAEAIKEKAGNPEESSQTVEESTQEQPEKANDKAVIETPFGEITLADAQKAVFKSEKEFQEFLEKNPLLKEGFMKDADYRRKTQQVALERKKFDEERKAFETEQNSLWGQKKPEKEDLAFFKDFWHIFQYGSNDVAGKLASIAQDVSLIVQGKQPVGPLSNQNGTPIDYSRDSELIKTRRDIDELRAEREREKKEADAEKQSRESREAKQEVDSWISEKAKQGINVNGPEFRQILSAMAPFSILRNEDGSRISFDEMHRLALAKLGKTEAHAIKKAITGAKNHSQKTPAKPASRVPSNAKPDAQSLDEILSEGREQLAQG